MSNEQAYLDMRKLLTSILHALKGGGLKPAGAWEIKIQKVLDKHP